MLAGHWVKTWAELVSRLVFSVICSVIYEWFDLPMYMYTKRATS